MLRFLTTRRANLIDVFFVAVVIALFLHNYFATGTALSVLGAFISVWLEQKAGS